MLALFAPLLGFALALLALYLLSQQVSIRLQQLVYLLTRSEEMMVLILFLVFLPGILVHEGAHWLMARALGLKTSKFRVWPQRKGRTIGMGSISVQTGGVWRDSLVGLAPLLAGIACMAFIAHRIFAAADVTEAWLDRNWLGGVDALGQALQQPDGALWAYLLFAIANAMMPSASDREPLRPVLLTIAGAALLYLVLGLPADPLTTALDWSTPLLSQLNSALIFTILLDGVIVLILGGLALAASYWK